MCVGVDMGWAMRWERDFPNYILLLHSSQVISFNSQLVALIVQPYYLSKLQLRTRTGSVLFLLDKNAD